uniref:Uncharacterized protein n=1 Tax=Populus alba TaxID=43335 RepID=A0A4U5QU41_POPAL|nr:hypothetical protein D5086_0000042150 [Populus alba]
MARRNGNVTSARRNMQYNLIGKLIKRHVVRGNTSVIVEPSFPAFNALSTKHLAQEIGIPYSIASTQELPQETRSIPFKVRVHDTWQGHVFEHARHLFGSQRSISSTSSLQLSSKDSSGLHYLQDNKTLPNFASAHIQQQPC